jgi:alanine-synthesizing transaminase
MPGTDQPLCDVEVPTIGAPRGITTSARLAGIDYQIRGRLHERAERLERDGHPVLKLNVGNPGAFGFRAPEEIVSQVAARLRDSQSYSPSRGLPAARQAVVGHSLGKGIPVRDEDDVYLGNGVSDLILMTLQAVVDPGDEILVPAPDYPLWTAGVRVAGGRAVHYPCDEAAGWLPDLAALEARITHRTKALVVINPNNPTGAVYPPELLHALVDVCRRHHLTVLSDEIYDQLVYDDLRHTSVAELAPDLLCLTFNGLSKAYLLAGYRSGWLVLTGPEALRRALRPGLDMLADMRLGANVPGQHAVQIALSADHGPSSLVLPGGRLREQRDAAHAAFSALPGVTCVRPQGGLYVFPRIDRTVWRGHDDQDLLLGLLLHQKVLLSPGSTFNWPRPDHVRIVTLAGVEELRSAAERLGTHLASGRVEHDVVHELRHRRTHRITY